MARLYSRKKGKSGSKRPLQRVAPAWMAHDKNVVEQLIIKLAKSRTPPAHIGTILRDTYGIPDIKAATGKRVLSHLKSNNITPNLPEDLTSLIKRDIIIMKHLESHKKDIPSRRGLQLTESKILRLSTYYKKKGVLPPEWTYDRSKAKLLVE